MITFPFLYNFLLSMELIASIFIVLYSCNWVISRFCKNYKSSLSTFKSIICSSVLSFSWWYSSWSPHFSYSLNWLLSKTTHLLSEFLPLLIKDPCFLGFMLLSLLTYSLLFMKHILHGALWKRMHRRSFFRNYAYFRFSLFYSNT